MSDISGVRSLSPSDQLALAALLRLLVRLDGKFSQEEQSALEEIALVYGEKTFWQMMDEAGRKLPDEDSIKRQALVVTEPGARELIFGCILGVAQADSVQGREQGLLEWLRAEWQLGESSG